LSAKREKGKQSTGTHLNCGTNYFFQTLSDYLLESIIISIFLKKFQAGVKTVQISDVVNTLLFINNKTHASNIYL